MTNAAANLAHRLRAVVQQEGLDGLFRRAGGRLLERWKRFSLYGTIGDAARLLAWVLLRPAADRLPRRAAMALAGTIGFLSALTPFYGLRTTGAVRRMYGLGVGEAVLHAARLLSQPMRDYVALRRILRGREAAEDLIIEEVNAELVRPLRESGASFIIATGHFVRRAHIALFLRSRIPQHVTQVSTPLPDRVRGLYGRWLFRHFGQLVEYTTFAGAGLATPRRRETARNLEEALSRPGNAISISVDAPWKNLESGLVRPFAGETRRCFATGAARLARKTGTPIVVCVPYLDPNERVVIEWLRVVPPPDPEDVEADARITDLLMDDIERAIGRHPTQYVIEHLGPRRWNRQTERWG